MIPAFDTSAQNFVRHYWETVRLGTFPMPPNEPVEESLDELLSGVTFGTEPSQKTKGAFLLTMLSKHGDWWNFTFREREGSWEVVECSASSDVPGGSGRVAWDDRPRSALQALGGWLSGRIVLSTDRHVGKGVFSGYRPGTRGLASDGKPKSGDPAGRFGLRVCLIDRHSPPSLG